MECPACKGAMVVAEYDRIETDYCTRCYGVWFDAGELELLLERMSVKDAGLALDEVVNPGVESRPSEKARRCPTCGRKMRKILVGSAPGVLIDTCTQGDGLWFDAGELDQLIEQLERKEGAASGGQERIIAFLAETFKARHDATSHSGGTA